MENVETLQSMFEWYESYNVVLLPFLVSIFVLGLSSGIFQLTKDTLFRTALLIPVFAVLLTLSYFTGAYGAELYLNLSAQVLMVLLAIGLVGVASQLNAWFTPIALLALIAGILQFFVPLNNIGTNIPITYGTAIIGAILAAYMLRQEWAWSPVKQEKRLSAQMRKDRSEQTARDEAFGDFYMLVSGHDKETITERLDFLRQHDMSVIQQDPIEYDNHTETYYQLVHVKIDTVVKDQDTVFLDNHEARLQILGYPDVVKRVYKQISEVLPLAKRQRMPAVDDAMVHLQVHATAPQRLYSAVLEEDFYALAREWQYSDDPHLQAATDALMDWAKAKHFVRQ